MATPVTETPAPNAAPAASPDSTPKPLDFTTAGDILNQAGGEHQARKSDALAEPEERDPLADPEEADPLAAGDLEPDLTGDDSISAEVGDTLPAGEGDDTVSPEAEEPVAEPKGAIDLSTVPPRVAAIIRHQQATGVSYEEAEVAIFGAPAGAEAAAQPEKVQAFDFTAAEAEIAKLKTDRREAAKDFTNPEKAIAITEQIEEKQRALNRQEALKEFRDAEAARAARDSQGQHQTREAAVLSEMETRFPEAFQPGKPLHDAILADRNRLIQSNPAFFNDADWAETLVRKHASRLSIAEKKPVAAAPAAAATPVVKPAAVPKKPARPLPAPGGRTATQTTTTDAEISAAIQKAKAAGDSRTLDFILKNGRLPVAA